MKRFFFCLVILGILPFKGWTLSPMYGPHDLVAGEGVRGFKDGSFTSALFKEPLGLALDSTKDQLFAADAGNERIRLIDLGDKNQVSTLAGNGKTGYVDGPGAQASFNRPSALVLLPNRQLAVFDDGNNRIRLIDLESKIVSTLAGNGEMGKTDGEALKAQVGWIWNMVYISSQDALFISQPEFGVIRKLDLKTRILSTVLSQNADLPSPMSLCVNRDELYASDRASGKVFLLKLKANPDPKDPQAFDLTMVSPPGQKVLALAWSAGSLYAIRTDLKNPLARLLPLQKPMEFLSVWGNLLKEPAYEAFFMDVQQPEPLSLIPDPSSDKKFYLSHPMQNIVTSFRDLLYDELKPNYSLNSNILQEFEYPEAKPPKTFRILIVGDSHTWYDYKIGEKNSDAENRMELLSKRLELELNSLASLEDVPLHFEVLTRGDNSGNPLNLWPYYKIPPLVKKYDLDLVLLLLFPYFNIEPYFQNPFTKEQIPVELTDMEFLLKPWKEKIPPGLPRKFYELCLAQKLVKPVNKTQLVFGSFHELVQHPEIRDGMVKLYGKPLKMLNEKVTAMKTSQGTAARLEVCLMPYPGADGMDYDNLFWKDILQEIGAPSLDFSDMITAFRVTYYPFSQIGGVDHYDANGHLLISFLLLHELLQKKIIPMEIQKK